ncbi:MAG: TatD family hydrolase [Reinekea sp.]
MPTSEDADAVDGWFDSHCHLNELINFQQAWAQACQHQITNCIIPGIEPSQWQSVIDALQSGCHAAAGIHPWYVTDDSIVEQLTALRNHLINTKVIAIGEIGLDFYPGGAPKPESSKQILMFEQQLQLATELQLPVIIHSVKAHQETLALIKKFSVKGVIHAFVGSSEIAEQYLRYGMYLGIGPALFKSKKLQKAVQHAPLSCLLLETDAPYMTSREDNPLLELLDVAQLLAQLKGLSVDTLQQQVQLNTRNLFFNLNS